MSISLMNFYCSFRHLIFNLNSYSYFIIHVLYHGFYIWLNFNSLKLINVLRRLFGILYHSLPVEHYVSFWLTSAVFLSSHSRILILSLYLKCSGNVLFSFYLNYHSAHLDYAGIILLEFMSEGWFVTPH